MTGGGGMGRVGVRRLAGRAVIECDAGATSSGWHWKQACVRRGKVIKG
jgi:hypothetical protein